MADESAVKVCVRVRPFIKREEADNAEPVQLHWKADKQAIHQIDDDGNMTKSFSFDRVFSAEESTKQLYNDIAKPLVVSTVEGYNGTIFAYGQTSSGKTFTMMGSEHNPGVIPLAMADVFHTIKNCPKKEFLLRVSYMEIYNETVTDLLCDSWKRKPLEIREGNYKNVYVADLTEELVTSPNQALAWIQKGEKNRHYGKTKMNQRSSRSHTIFRMILESRERSDPASGENRDSAIIVSHLNLVDLAGAERASQTGAEGARLKEGCNINRSLFTLGQVIKKLSDESQKGFTNYRDSKLTRILQNSLGGNAKTVIICTITPATVDETVSTLQFASTAKRMKNDPHVTEVSDDGALLRRYRDEIADLKQRLQEVSSITQTTATEKESLTQLLQEKDQLQREQADRIRNLTKLLVTSSNVGPVQKIPKRRVTWGGKLLKSPLLMSNDDGSPDMSFAEPFLKKRKADLTVTEESEDMEEFDTPCFYSSVEDCPMNQSNVTIRCSAEGEYTDSPQVHFRIECLERQLETETQEKQKAEEKSMMLEQRTEELEKQLQSLEQQLEVEVQEKQRAEQKCSTLELKVAEREKPSESEDDCKAREQCLEEAVQLCHTLSSEREVIAAERDLLKQRLELLMQDNQALVKNQETLLRDIEEQKDAEEFEKLEEETKKDYERELEAEISALKTALVDTEDLVQKLKSDLEMMSGELKKKNDLVADLQSLDGRDLVQEVTQLRRSLDDAEGLSLETKKEWAFLRSENLSLRERDATLTAQHNQMENEVKSLQSQLESEKTRFKKMQADLQKELLRAFDENTKLTALLDGKVPKNVLDNLTLEKTVAELKKELEKSQESEGALQSKMEELEVLPAKVEDLLRQVCEFSGELYSVQKERDDLISAQAVSNEDNERLKGEVVKAQEELQEMQKELTDAELKKVQLSEQYTETTEQLAKAQTDLEHLLEENGSLLSALEEAKQKSVQLGEDLESLRCERERHLSELTTTAEQRNQLQEAIHSEDSEQAENVQNLQAELQTIKEERDQLKKDMEENVELMIENQGELRASLEKAKVQEDKILQLEAEKAQLESRLSNPAENSLVEDLQIQVKQLKETLQSACTERDNIESERALDAELERMQTIISSLTEERDQLQEILQVLREEKNHLKKEMEEKDELILRVQSDLNKEQFSDSSCVTSEENPVQLQQVQDLKKEAEELTRENSQLRTELQDLTDKMMQLKEDFQCVSHERERLMAENAKCNLEKIEELDRHQANIRSLTEERDQLLDVLHSMREEKNQLQSDLDKKDEMVGELSGTLSAVQDEKSNLLVAQSTLNEENLRVKEDLEKAQEELVRMESQMIESQLKEAEISQQHMETTEQLVKVQADLEHFTEENGKLLMSLEEANQKMMQLKEDFQCASHERECLVAENAKCNLEKIEELDRYQANIRSLIEERDQLLDVLHSMREEKNQLQSDLDKKDEMMMQLKEDFQCASHERERLMAENAKCNLEKIEELDRHQANIRSLTEERDQLLDVLHSMREEKNQLQSDLDKKDEMIQELKELQTEREQSSIKDASCSTNVDEDGESLQEILQGVRELIQVQGELKQLKPLSPRATRKAELQQANQIMQVLKEEVGYLRNERMLLKKELQEAAETSKAYQNLLHSMKEEQKKQQQNVDSVTQSAEKDSVLQQQVSQLNVNLSYLREQLLSKKTSETQNCNTEMQTLLTRVVFLEEKANLQEETNLRCALQESEQTKHKLMEELQSLEGIKEQLLNEQTHAAQLQEVFHGVREERDQLQRELERKMEELSHIEKKVQGLEKEKMLLESKVSSLSQSLHEVNEHSNALSSEGRLKVILEFETCNTKLKVAFLKLQAIVDRPNRKDHLADANSKENVSFCQLLRFVPLSQRSVFTCLSSKTSHLDDLLRKNEVTLQRLAALHKAHFMKQVHSDVASFEERRLHDVLIRRAQAPSQSFQMVPGDFQEIWDQRLLELLDKRRQYLQNMNSILDFLEDAVAKHAVTLSEELQARTRANEEMRALAGSANATAIAQFFERELVRRTALADRQRNFRKSMLDKYDAAVSVLKPLEEESLQRLKEDRSESLALLPSPSSEKPKTEADLLQDKQRLSLQLQQAQKHLEVLQKKMEELKAQTDVSNQKHAAKLEELSSALKEKEDLIQNLQMKLKESEALAKLKRSPSAAEMEAMKDKLVKMELDHIAVTTGHEKEIAQLTAVVEHRGDVIYKLKETLRKTQQQGDRSFMVGEEPHSNPGTQAKASVCLKDKKIEELEKKSAQFESLVNKQQDEITKWKNRAYKLRESKKEAPHSPRTPTKRPLLTNSEVNSPKKMFLDSPKSKFFDVHADTEAMSLKCPKQFFDNSSLGTMPDSDPNAAGSSSDAESWWRIPNTSPRKTNLNLDANNCSTQ
ncbi:centromere-associated protein E isoform X4 [Neoarius graeffei]|uniref:centromere-associated protein E isoform X4 n=1 Tax=Neoarius graeffei TaxID=443677 RepID=UPI00298C3FBC|nr:centromere-associated protein E isoform X4 [Neoarius graeffei]